jgi:medium-chain acyl-[acyl-carrier-protein] hydrolase
MIGERHATRAISTDALMSTDPVEGMPSSPVSVSLALSDWIGMHARQNVRPESTRLLCFPYAGGGASVFRQWAALAPSSVTPIPVHLPGRENRWNERPYVDLAVLVQELAAVLKDFLRRPFALFGHSMGAFIVFELARELRRMKYPAPRRLFISGCRAPHIPDPDPPLFALPKPEFLRQLTKLNGVPSEVLANEEFIEWIAPTLRADFQMCDTYEYRADEPFDFPISVFGGSEDRKTRPAHLSSWRAHTRSDFVERFLPGDHFFMMHSQDVMLQAIAGDLRATAVAGSRSGSLQS